MTDILGGGADSFAVELVGGPSDGAVNEMPMDPAECNRLAVGYSDQRAVYRRQDINPTSGRWIYEYDQEASQA